MQVRKKGLVAMIGTHGRDVYMSFDVREWVFDRGCCVLITLMDTNIHRVNRYEGVYLHTESVI